MTDKRIYWRHELPPLDAVIEGEHVVEAESRRVPHHAMHQDAQWADRYDDLMAVAARRIEQELDRLGGDLAHVTDEDVCSKVDAAEGTYRLTGRFTFVRYRRPAPP